MPSPFVNGIIMRRIGFSAYWFQAVLAGTCASQCKHYATLLCPAASGGLHTPTSVKA